MTLQTWFQKYYLSRFSAAHSKNRELGKKKSDKRTKIPHPNSVSWWAHTVRECKLYVMISERERQKWQNFCLVSKFKQQQKISAQLLYAINICRRIRTECHWLKRHNLWAPAKCWHIYKKKKFDTIFFRYFVYCGRCAEHWIHILNHTTIEARERNMQKSIKLFDFRIQRNIFPNC